MLKDTQTRRYFRLCKGVCGLGWSGNHHSLLSGRMPKECHLSFGHSTIPCARSPCKLKSLLTGATIWSIKQKHVTRLANAVPAPASHVLRDVSAGRS